ncbi:MAG TPA: sugar transferase [Gaiellaceae bacterium]|jgi:lipopolysaccharide/colanic/teichoic acid biosynthesis glycosyltransferase|nr:sugar transferase [Gaiellaceae bacterium]
MTTRRYELAKRAFDLTVASSVGVLAAPLLGAIAAAIKFESRGPLFFRQERIGRHGRPFEIVKFRTLVDSPPGEPADYLISKSDPRITRVGAFLRRWSLDELPQVWNVLRGDMSIVGPRPTLRYQVERYDDFQRRRLEVLPGVTGWAQVSGRNELSWPERIKLDVWYVDHRSFSLDLSIVAATVKTLFQPSSIYDDAQGDWGERPS